jgi:hypothetical protein
MAKPIDPFDPVNLQLPEDIVSQLKGRRKSMLSDGELRCRVQSKEFRFYQFPAKMLERLAITTKSPALILLCVLYRLHVRSGRNPVILTTKILQSFGISRHQKVRALKFLEKADCIAVNWRPRKNPEITLKWRSCYVRT